MKRNGDYRELAASRIALGEIRQSRLRPSKRADGRGSRALATSRIRNFLTGGSKDECIFPFSLGSPRDDR